ncbi:hypothetical protein EDB89DRAFT_1900477 [Lactarius sanguifluus]|nr:hypothetical protein EDB89DRAFT_1900477 [Lactarius sanguifluus]
MNRQRRTLPARAELSTHPSGQALLPTSPALGPSLPYAEIYGLQPHRFSSQALHIDAKVTPTLVAGPIPRSWAVTTAPAKAFESPEWRETALSLFFAQNGGSSGPVADARPAGTAPERILPPRHTEVCGTDADVLKDFVPASLRVLLGEEHNQVDGELIVVEPSSPLRPELFQSEQFGAQKNPEGLWDADVTRLALVNLSAPVPLHRLPDKCPLLEVLDISYNDWLGEPAWGGERALEKVAWQRWAYLKILGCRECGIALEELRRVNEGRWDDVTIVT